jgi:hypothetical protein
MTTLAVECTEAHCLQLHARLDSGTLHSQHCLRSMIRSQSIHQTPQYALPVDHSSRQRCRSFLESTVRRQYTAFHHRNRTWGDEAGLWG